MDAVILVTARRSEDRLWRELKARKAEWAPNGIQDLFRAGDCKAPVQLNQAMWDAHRLAREFDSPHPAYPLPWIRERQLWGGETIPKLGDQRVNVEGRFSDGANEYGNRGQLTNSARLSRAAT